MWLWRRPTPPPQSGLRREARGDELGEGVGAVADAVLLVRLDLAEGEGPALGDEHRVVAEAAVAARRPDQVPVDLAAEGLGVSVGPGERERRDEMGAPVRLALQLRLDAGHRDREILGRPRPARRIDP